MKERFASLLITGLLAATVLYWISREQSRERAPPAREPAGMPLDARLEAMESRSAALAGQLEAGAAALGALKVAVTGLGAAQKQSDEADAARWGGLEAKLDACAKRLDEASAVLAGLRGTMAEQAKAIEAKLEAHAGASPSPGLEARVAAMESALQRLLERLPAPGAPSSAPAQGQGGAPSPPGGVTSHPAPPAPEPAVSAVVEAVDETVVVVGAGSRAGLLEGHILEVRREGRLVGRVRVLRLEPDMAGAEVVETSAEGPIRAGDQASTPNFTSTHEGAASTPPGLGIPRPPPPPRSPLSARD